jgi:hypothetical protein
MMGTDLSVNHVKVEILNHVDTTFFTQNKPMSNHSEGAVGASCTYIRANKVLVTN